jgi:phosphate-selective porin OprO/OprP
MVYSFPMLALGQTELPWSLRSNARATTPPENVEDDSQTGVLPANNEWNAPPAEMSLEQQLQMMRQEFNAMKEGLSKPKFPAVEIHGVFQVDSGWFDQSAANRAAEIGTTGKTIGNIKDGASFRRARLSANGSVLPNMNYFLQMDFAFFGRPTFTDVWMELTKVPVVGNVRVGQWKQPFSLEVVSSFRYTTFAERSLLFQSFVPFRHVAVGFYDWSENERMTWAASVYRPGQDQFGGSLSDTGGYAGVGRITALPWWEEEGRRYLHAGIGYNYVAPKDRVAQFRTIPEYYVGENVGVTLAGSSGQAAPGNFNGTPFFADTGKNPIHDYHLLGNELLLVEGPFSWQSEAMFLWANRPADKNAFFWGGYSQVGYFLTGEHRPYNRKQGAIDRIQVKRPIGRRHDPCEEWGWGGWEVAARLSHVELNSMDIRGGRMTDFTFGLNWYLNNYSKIQFNYIRAFLDSPTKGDSTADIYGLRAQLDF